jgi:hypothetical protein
LGRAGGWCPLRPEITVDRVERICIIKNMDKKADRRAEYWKKVAKKAKEQAEKILKANKALKRAVSEEPIRIERASLREEAINKSIWKDEI